MATNGGGNADLGSIDDVVLRRSTRSKRKRELFTEEIVMSVRRSRASGTSDLVAVESVGGRHKHRKRSTTTFKPEKSQRPKFCWNCGQSHSGRANFCIKCGKPRDEPCDESDDEEEASSCAASSATNESYDIEGAASSCVASSATTESADVQGAASSCVATTTKTGRPRAKKTLRCGWTKEVDENSCLTLTAPNGRKFNSWAEASKYKNAAVPTLEPMRKDGWEVYVDNTRTHTMWIAPDNTTLQSFVAAKAYAKSANLPLYGKDGIQRGITSFFGVPKARPTPPPKQSDAVQPTPPPTRSGANQPTPPPTRTGANKPTPTPMPSLPTLPPSKPRPFTVPSQTDKGKELMLLCRRAAIYRKRRRTKQLLNLNVRIASEYTARSQLSANFAQKVNPMSLLCRNFT